MSLRGLMRLWDVSSWSELSQKMSLVGARMGSSERQLCRLRAGGSMYVADPANHDDPFECLGGES